MLLGLIDLYLRRTGLSASAFGREAVNDPRFVHDLRRGREPRTPMKRRILTFLAGSADAR